MNTSCFKTRTIDDRDVVVWRSQDEKRANGLVVVLTAGFARRMRNVAAVALYLTKNGCTVYRYDPVDHVGFSDGELLDFTLSGAQRSLAAVIDLANAMESVDELTLVGMSLLARPMLRQASVDSRVARVVMMAGVVDVRATVARAFGRDYVSLTLAELPETIQFERHHLRTNQIWRDIHEHGWADLQGTREDLARIVQPVVAIHSSEDEWSDIDDLKKLFAAAENSGPRYLFQLPYGEHDLKRNPVAQRIVLSQLTKAVLAPRLEEIEKIDPALPSFEELVEITVAERAKDHEEHPDTQARAVGN